MYIVYRYIPSLTQLTKCFKFVYCKNEKRREKRTLNCFWTALRWWAYAWGNWAWHLPLAHATALIAAVAFGSRWSATWARTGQQRRGKGGIEGRRNRGGNKSRGLGAEIVVYEREHMWDSSGTLMGHSTAKWMEKWMRVQHTWRIRNVQRNARHALSRSSRSIRAVEICECK